MLISLGQQGTWEDDRKTRWSDFISSITGFQAQSISCVPVWVKTHSLALTLQVIWRTTRFFCVSRWMIWHSLGQIEVYDVERARCRGQMAQESQHRRGSLFEHLLPLASACIHLQELMKSDCSEMTGVWWWWESIQRMRDMWEEEANFWKRAFIPVPLLCHHM